MQSVYKEAMRRVINEQAEALYKDMGLSMNFKIEEAVKQLDGEITVNPCLDESIEAKISATEDAHSFIIECPKKLNTDEGNVRFAIAHEIGHLFLHMLQFDGNGAYTINGNFYRGKDNSSLTEWEAEEFAAAFLMPKNVFQMEVDSVWADDDIENKISELAKKFGVPFKSIITRGKGLGIW